jgi:hypothetical protein
MKVLANLADLCVGVPAGPYHLAMAKPSLPTVGICKEYAATHRLRAQIEFAKCTDLATF